jgi:SAM-dependent methyltransferase
MLSTLKHARWYDAFKQTRKAIKRRIALPRYLGDIYCCPVCNTRLAAFKPIWKSYHRMIAESGYIYPLTQVETFNFEAYSCPACDASDRERLYALYLKPAIAAQPSGRRLRFVEFAPAPSLERMLRSEPRLDYRSADLFRGSVDDKIDITDMRPYGDASVDIFLCSHILEHIPDDRAAISELFRVAAPGGFGIVMVPLIVGLDETLEDPRKTTRELRCKHYGDGDHVRQYGKRDFVQRLQQAGFRVEQLGVEHFGAEAFRLAGIAENSVLFVAHKPQ